MAEPALHEGMGNFTCEHSAHAVTKKCARPPKVGQQGRNERIDKGGDGVDRGLLPSTTVPRKLNRPHFQPRRQCRWPQAKSRCRPTRVGKAKKVHYGIRSRRGSMQPAVFYCAIHNAPSKFRNIAAPCLGLSQGYAYTSNPWGGIQHFREGLFMDNRASSLYPRSSEMTVIRNRRRESAG